MNQTPWILLDTETSGIKAPVFVVELAAQRMRGWEPEGEPFRRLLNHNSDMSPEASRVNGYTREILERDGDPPLNVYEDFAEYVGDLPLVSYNLKYDLDSVLQPEWSRLGVAPIGNRGFCALELAQRLLDPVPAGNHKLQTLRQYYRLPERGAHTALGDVETVADLMQQVLKPLAKQRGLLTWDEIVDFGAATWFPSRIAFGKYKGRDYQEAIKDPDLHGWLEWLAQAKNSRSVSMGRWYLEQLESGRAFGEKQTPVTGAPVINSGEVVVYQAAERATLNSLIASARERLADLEAQYTQEHHAVEVVRSRLFEKLRPFYQKLDELKLKVSYRRKYIDLLLVGGEEEAEEVKQEHERAQAETEQEYKREAALAVQNQALSEEEEQELKRLWRKLVRLYHPDRYAHDPEKHELYTRLTSEINSARDRGDIQRLREIAEDLDGFLAREGLGGLNLDDDSDLTKLRALYDSLQARIMELLETLEELRESSDYELYRLTQEQPELLQEVADAQASDIATEITELETEAAKLAEEIENLTEAPNAVG
ncbi:exonuclease domain-containing protein [Haliea sp.]|uniref:exonuclease domain-containing protein n=1 Tax=Haliea sp. TaxID=1932666 RepID=UPI0035288475